MITACGVSDRGTTRKTNEDSFVADPDIRLFAVADGMGGHAAGEVASRLAIEAVTGFIRRSAADTDFSWPFGVESALSFDANRLRTAIYLANRRVLRAAESEQKYDGMGTTIVGLLVNGSRMSVAHVGDSRLYVLSGGEIRQMTADDSWAASVLAQDPTLGPADIANHPMRNVLTSVLGVREPVDVHVSEHDLGSSDTMLLCSDGLHNVLEPEAIRDILSSAPDVDHAARVLVETALENGSKDNVTAVVVKNQP